MYKAAALAFGLITCLPIVYVAFFVYSIISMVTAGVSGRLDDPESSQMAAMVLPLHLLTMVLMVVLVAIYIVHLFRTERIPRDLKALWAIVLLLGALIAMPIYWYLYIWRDPPHAGGAQPADENAAGASHSRDIA